MMKSSATLAALAAVLLNLIAAANAQSTFKLPEKHVSFKLYVDSTNAAVHCNNQVNLEASGVFAADGVCIKLTNVAPATTDNQKYQSVIFDCNTNKANFYLIDNCAADEYSAEELEYYKDFLTPIPHDLEDCFHFPGDYKQFKFECKPGAYVLSADISESCSALSAERLYSSQQSFYDVASCTRSVDLKTGSLAAASTKIITSSESEWFQIETYNSGTCTGEPVLTKNVTSGCQDTSLILLSTQNKEVSFIPETTTEPDEKNSAATLKLGSIGLIYCLALMLLL